MTGIVAAAILLPVILVVVAFAGNRYLPRLSGYGAQISLVIGVLQVVGAIIKLFVGPRTPVDWFASAVIAVIGAFFILLSRRMRAVRNGPVA